MNKKLLLSSILLTLSIFLLTVPAKAENDDATSNEGRPDIKRMEKDRNFGFMKDNEERRENFGEMKEKFKEKMLERKENWEEKRAKVCENIEERVSEKVANFERNKEKHIEGYNKLIGKLEEIATKMSAEGLDTDKLEEDTQTLGSMIEEYKVMYQEFIDSIDFSRGFACKDKDDDFRTNLNSSKEKLKALHEKRADIREYYGETIREDIKDLREQLAEEVENSGDEE